MVSNHPNLNQFSGGCFRGRKLLDKNAVFSDGFMPVLLIVTGGWSHWAHIVTGSSGWEDGQDGRKDRVVEEKCSEEIHRSGDLPFKRSV